METLITVLFYIALFYLMMRFGCGAHMKHGKHNKKDNNTTPVSSIDPVCNKNVPEDEGYTLVYQGEPYRFCSRHCLDQFEKQPASFSRTPSHHTS